MSHGRTRLAAVIAAVLVAATLLVTPATAAMSGGKRTCAPPPPPRHTAAAAARVACNTLTVQVQGQGGKVTGDGIDCQAQPGRAHRGAVGGCTGSFSGPTVLTAVLDDGYHVAQWAGCDYNMRENSCTVQMASNTTVSVRFERIQYYLSVRVHGGGRVTSDPGDIDCRTSGKGLVRDDDDDDVCLDTYGQDEEVMLTAKPDPGQEFTGWSTEGDDERGRRTPAPACAGSDPTCAFAMAANVRITATFEPVKTSPYLLRVNTAGAGTGTVTGAGDVCSTLCWYPFDRGSSVTLTAVPAAGSTFAGFTGAPCSSNPCTIAMTESRYVTAKFDLSPTDAPDTTAPDTRITFTPTNPSNDHSWFRFTATETGATFQCSLDGAPGVDCTSPVDYPCLAPGRHTFRVWATDPAGNADVTPADHRFTVRAGRHC